MGGGGSFYTRDVSPRAARTRTGATTIAQTEMSRRNVNPAMLPMDRRLACATKAALFYLFDVTGSMRNLPQIIFDKMPMIAGQIAQRHYLGDDFSMSVGGIGDVTCDHAPVQISDLSQIKTMDDWLKRLWLEGGGGGSSEESYEYFAYYLAYMVDFPDDGTDRYCIFTGDEGFYEDLHANELKAHFGGQHESTTATKVFKDLLKKFNGNVFIIRKRYGSADYNTRIQKQWEKVLGKSRVIPLPEDTAIGDISLGILALVGGSRTLDEYCEDMQSRDQDTGRISKVRAALNSLSLLNICRQARGRWLERQNAEKAVAEAELNAAASSDPPKPTAGKAPPKKKKRRF